MNTLQINNILKKELGHVFKGVYALDQIARLNPRVPAAYVFNTKPSTSPGEHWVAAYIMSNRKAVYFDSLGFQPRHTQIIAFLKKNMQRNGLSQEKQFKIRSQPCVVNIVLHFYLVFITTNK